MLLLRVKDYRSGEIEEEKELNYSHLNRAKVLVFNSFFLNNDNDKYISIHLSIHPSVSKTLNPQSTDPNQIN